MTTLDDEQAYRRGYYEGLRAGVKDVAGNDIPDSVRIFLEGWLYLWSRAGGEPGQPPAAPPDDALERWKDGIINHLAHAGYPLGAHSHRQA